MESMSRKTVLILMLYFLIACGGGLMLLLPVGCGGGDAKRAFEEYEAAVGPLLDAEEKNYGEFRELSADAFHYGADEKVSKYIRKVLTPFYAKMEQSLEAVKPEGEELASIHQLLLDYVGHRRKTFDVFREMEGLDSRFQASSAELRAKIHRLGLAAEKKGKAIQPAFEAAPEDGQRVLETLGQIAQMAQNTQQSLDALQAGGVPSDQYLAYVDKQVRPFIAAQKKNLADVTVTPKGKVLVATVVTYLEAIETLLEASRPLAEARKKVEQTGAPVQQRLAQQTREADRTFEVYKEEARKYRDSLR
jgi:hypothetical protein